MKFLIGRCSRITQYPAYEQSDSLFIGGILLKPPFQAACAAVPLRESETISKMI